MADKLPKEFRAGVATGKPVEELIGRKSEPEPPPEPGDLSDTALFGAIRDAKIKMDEALDLALSCESRWRASMRVWDKYKAEVDRRSRPVMTGGVDGR